MNFCLKTPVVLDVETTIINKGNPFTLNNKLITIQIKTKTNELYFTKENFSKCLPYLHNASIIIGSNLKFDLNWLEKELNFKAKSIWDLQIAEFLFSNQEWTFPDVETMAIKYEVGHKIDTIKHKYWDNDIDTDKIPIEELIEYGINDVNITYKIFLKQIEKFKTTNKNQFFLFRLHCNDLLSLQDMEYNGIIYNEEASIEKAIEIEQSIQSIENKLNSYHSYNLNYNSNDDISLLLYGGSKEYKTKLPIGFYKTGNKIGQIRNKIIKKIISFPRLVQPLKNSLLKKEGFYSVDEPTLLSLKPTKKVKEIITLLLERSKLIKINGTYLKGLPKIIKEMNWPPNKLHSTLNQCLAKSGRLSSSKPNQQNLAPLAKQFCISRY